MQELVLIQHVDWIIFVTEVAGSSPMKASVGFYAIIQCCSSFDPLYSSAGEIWSPAVLAQSTITVIAALSVHMLYNIRNLYSPLIATVTALKPAQEVRRNVSNSKLVDRNSNEPGHLLDLI